MKNIKSHLSNHYFFYIISFLTIVVGVLSYFRFIVRQDYIIGYEGVCDSSIDKCFIGCEDDECTSSYYYSQMQKYAADLYNECGPDITDCEEASMCLPGDRDCSITYCDPETDGDICSIPTEELDIQDNDQAPIEEESLLDNNVINVNI